MPFENKINIIQIFKIIHKYFHLPWGFWFNKSKVKIRQNKIHPYNIDNTKIFGVPYVYSYYDASRMYHYSIFWGGETESHWSCVIPNVMRQSEASMESSLGLLLSVLVLTLFKSLFFFLDKTFKLDSWRSVPP